MRRERFIAVTGLVFFAAALRILPHPWNATPVAAMALFAGARVERWKFSVLVPLLSMFLSDLVLGFHQTMPFVYGALVLTVCLGRSLRGRSRFLGVASGAVASSLLFYVVTNFGHWLVTPDYPHTWAGLGACYVAALPFLRGTMIGDMGFVFAFFYGFQILERSIPSLREPLSAA